ncbi:uncharacterized protein LOC113771512 [Coffea eugenioides]|nr:uncharacterized protein LOC113771512 [Coffea eugenioides]
MLPPTTGAQLQRGYHGSYSRLIIRTFLRPSPSPADFAKQTLSVGVQGDQRTHSHVVALRAVTSQDGMTADWYNFEHNFLDVVARKICNSVRGVNRVVQDITSKPPSTIEWE